MEPRHPFQKSSTAHPHELTTRSFSASEVAGEPRRAAPQVRTALGQEADGGHGSTGRTPIRPQLPAGRGLRRRPSLAVALGSSAPSPPVRPRRHPPDGAARAPAAPAAWAWATARPGLSLARRPGPGRTATAAPRGQGTRWAQRGAGGGAGPEGPRGGQGRAAASAYPTRTPPPPAPTVPGALARVPCRAAGGARHLPTRLGQRRAGDSGHGSC